MWPILPNHVNTFSADSRVHRLLVLLTNQIRKADNPVKLDSYACYKLLLGVWTLNWAFYDVFSQFGHIPTMLENRDFLSPPRSYIKKEKIFFCFNYVYWLSPFGGGPLKFRNLGYLGQIWGILKIWVNYVFRLYQTQYRQYGYQRSGF